MQKAYASLAHLVALLVVVQAAVMVYAIAGLGKWVDEDGGVLDKETFNDRETEHFPEIVGFMIHGMNGMMVIPVVALALLIVSFFAKVPGGIAWAGAVLGLVVLQVALGIVGHSIPFVGGLHGINALVLFSVAIYTGLRARRVVGADVPMTAGV